MQEAKVVLDFLFPPDQQTPSPVGPGVRAFDDPTSGFPGDVFVRVSSFFLECDRCSRVAWQSRARHRHRSLVAAKVLPLSLVGRGRWTGMPPKVSRTKVWSCALARSPPQKSHALPIGEHDRLTPNLPRSVGFFPVFSPPSVPWSSIRPNLPLPIDPFHLVVFSSASFHNLANTRVGPFLEVAWIALPEPNSLGIAFHCAPCRERRKCHCTFRSGNRGRPPWLWRILRQQRLHALPERIVNW